MPTKRLQERASGSKNGHGIPPLRAFCGCWQAHEQEKKLQDKTDLFVDRTYHLYAIVRRGNEEVPHEDEHPC